MISRSGSTPSLHFTNHGVFSKPVLATLGISQLSNDIVISALRLGVVDEAAIVELDWWIHDGRFEDEFFDTQIPLNPGMSSQIVSGQYWQNLAVCSRGDIGTHDVRRGRAMAQRQRGVL